MRDHEPIVIKEFNGLWKRGDRESTPDDHFSDCNNIRYIEGGFETRPGIAQFVIDANNCINYSNVKRIYRYPRPDGPSDRLLVLDGSGNIYDSGSPTPCTAILTIPNMTDFSVAFWAGRAYITPHDGILGLPNEFVYVYLGYGAVARKAAGNAPTGTLTIVHGAAVNSEIVAGYHVFGVVFETDTGFLTQIGAKTAFLANGAQTVDISNIPVSAQSFVTKRHLVATKAIDALTFTGNVDEYQFFFIPNGTINDNTTTTVSSLEFYDSDLIEDASYLEDALEEIPAGVFITTYHNRLVVGGFYGQANSDPDLDTSEEISTARVSTKGEPEAFDGVDGIIVAPIDGNPLTNAQEYRDLIYLFKNTRTHAYVDNGDVPSTWELSTIDQGKGASVHGIATVLDSGGINIEYIIIANYAGVSLFNGTFSPIDLSWKIQDLWLALDRTQFNLIQIVNDTVGQVIYIVLPDGTMLIADYDDGLNPKDIKWAPWSSEAQITTIALVNTNMLIVGAFNQMP